MKPRTRCASTTARAGLQQRRKHRLAQMIERYLVAEEEVSLVVIASTTSEINASDPAFIFWTSSVIPGSPILRANGTNRLSTRYCLSGDRSSPDRSFRNLRKNS